MNKELETLTKLKNINWFCPKNIKDTLYVFYKNDFDAIETALKRLEVYETFGLLDEKYDDVDKLTDIKGKLTYVDKVMDTQERLLASVSSDEIRILSSVLNSQIRKLKNKLKALEIIKEKGIILQFIKETYTVEQYNAGVFGTLVKPLTKEEYDLLKEVLL